MSSAKRALWFLLPLSLGIWILGVGLGQGRAQISVEVSGPLPVEGPLIFRDYCAACHGLSGKGDGPVSKVLKTRPADLTRIAAQNGGVFPEARVRHAIDGNTVSHGTREMPVWGPIFHEIENDQDLGNIRMDSLIRYLMKMQQK